MATCGPASVHLQLSTPFLCHLLPAAQPGGTRAGPGQHGACAAAAARALRGRGGDWRDTSHGAEAAAERERIGGAAGTGGRLGRRSSRGAGSRQQQRRRQSASGGTLASPSGCQPRWDKPEAVCLCTLLLLPIRHTSPFCSQIRQALTFSDQYVVKRGAATYKQHFQVQDELILR